RIEENEFADVVTQALATLFPQDPPRFMARTPHGHYDLRAWDRELSAAGFLAPVAETIAARSVAPRASDVAMAYCQGTPLRSEIEARGGALEEATRVCAQAIEERFGPGPVDGKIQAHVVTAERGAA
ncbi:MAG TPA: hypothetical protein VM029_02165, partial [Opitutaceae bacterium]|nr:hypothetical protein [Opitutaceae bacterium]